MDKVFYARIKGSGDEWTTVSRFGYWEGGKYHAKRTECRDSNSNHEGVSELYAENICAGDSECYDYFNGGADDEHLIEVKLGENGEPEVYRVYVDFDPDFTAKKVI